MTKLCSKNFKVSNLNQSKFLSKDLDYSKVITNLKNEGYHIFEEKISEDMINKLIDFSKMLNVMYIMMMESIYQHIMIQINIKCLQNTKFLHQIF